MSNDSQTGFFDKRTLIAVAFMALFFVGWQMYLAKKYPQSGATEDVAAQTAPLGKAVDSKALENPKVEGVGATTTSETQQLVAPTEKEIVLEYPNWKITLSSVGMGLKEVVLKNYMNREMHNVSLGKALGNYLYGVKLNGVAATPNFEMTKVSENEVQGTAEVEGIKIVRNFVFNPETYSVRSKVTVAQADAKFTGVSVYLPEEKIGAQKSSMFMPQFEHQDFVLNASGKVERVNINSAKDPVTSEFKTVSMAGIGSQYFASAIVDQSKIIPTFRTAFGPSDASVVGELKYSTVNGEGNFEIDTVGYFGPKSLSILKSVDENFVGLINFGIFSFLAYPLLAILKAFFAIVGNWGIAIILLTLLVRLAVMPFNVMSYKSMKAMQKVNPMIQGLRDRYKDDPQTLNREMMELFKTHKVNPMGGCLPMLLQIPVFFALYQVLGQSIELYQAPFLGWIHDLSLKDPFYILPVAMGVAMFVQQKITPTTMDPTQAKIMLFMPIMFSFMMFSLPSGLTLYIFVSTLFAIFQQVVFLRDKKA